MTEYDFTQTINSTQLLDEISTAGLPAPAYIDTSGACVQIFYPSALTGDQLATLTSVISAHNPNPAYVTLATQAAVTKLTSYLNSANATVANTARAVMVANLAPRLQDGMLAIVNAQIASIVGF